MLFKWNSCRYCPVCGNNINTHRRKTDSCSPTNKSFCGTETLWRMLGTMPCSRLCGYSSGFFHFSGLNFQTEKLRYDLDHQSLNSNFHVQISLKSIFIFGSAKINLRIKLTCDIFKIPVLLLDPLVCNDGRLWGGSSCCFHIHVAKVIL